MLTMQLLIKYVLCYLKVEGQTIYSVYKIYIVYILHVKLKIYSIKYYLASEKIRNLKITFYLILLY